MGGVHDVETRPRKSAQVDMFPDSNPAELARDVGSLDGGTD